VLRDINKEKKITFFIVFSWDVIGAPSLPLF
jgi:hypothetical protein